MPIETRITFRHRPHASKAMQHFNKHNKGFFLGREENDKKILWVRHDTKAGQNLFISVFDFTCKTKGWAATVRRFNGG